MKPINFNSLCQKLGESLTPVVKKPGNAISETIQTTAATESVVNPVYYQAVNGIDVSLPLQLALKQSKFYREFNFVPASERILDGFKDGGSYAKFLDDGSIVDATREIIVVDRTKDEKLSAIIKDFHLKIKDIDTDEEMKSDFVQRYIFDNFAKKSINAQPIEYPSGKEKYLGEILQDGTPVCRHLALLYKILGDDIELKVDLMRGLTTFNNMQNRHAWVQVLDDGCSAFFDPTNKIVTPYLEDIVDSVHGRIYCKYEAPEGVNLY